MRARTAQPLALVEMISEKRAKNRELIAVLHADPTPVPIKNNYLARFFRAAAAPFFPNAVRTRDGRFAMVRFFVAAAAAFFIFLRAAARCFSVAIFPAPSRNRAPDLVFLRMHLVVAILGLAFAVLSCRTHRGFHRKPAQRFLIPIDMRFFLT